MKAKTAKTEKIGKNLFLIKADSIKKNKILLKEFSKDKNFNVKVYSEDFNSIRKLNKNKADNFDIIVKCLNDNISLTKTEVNFIIKNFLKGH